MVINWRRMLRSPSSVYFFIFAVIFIAATSPHRIQGDFDVYYTAGLHFLKQSQVYIFHNGIEEFKYSPISAGFFSLFTLFSKSTAIYIWNFVNALFITIIFYHAFKTLGIKMDSTKGILLTVLTIAILSRPILNHIKIGQINIAICLLLTSVYYFSQFKNNDVMAGLFLALSLMIKFFPLVFLAYYMVRGKFRLVAYCFLFIVLFLLLPSLYVGWQGNLNYLQEWYALLKASPNTIFYSPKNNSLFSFLSWFFVVRESPYAIYEYFKITTPVPNVVPVLWLVLSISFFLFFFKDTLFRSINKHSHYYIDFACLFILGLLIRPIAFKNAFVFLIIPMIICLNALLFTAHSKMNKFIFGFFIFFTILLLNFFKESFFSDIQLYYSLMQLKPLMWGAISLYTCLYMVKLGRV